MSSSTSDDAPTGPENPRGPAGPDAPAPPGSPMRSDAPSEAAVTGSPGRERGRDPEPSEPGATLQEGSEPRTRSQPEPTSDGQIHARTQAEQANRELQEENAETSLDQPSDGGGEG